ncbi:MAG: peptide-methionine (S)-S-oxide reductase MsrA [Anaerolineaceae bacterium]|nr:peptide-methionine (S)-S-oxide reductase MsrA [Anaerolineaceae bacterium]
MNQNITLGGGCFWCLEAVYQLVNGVKSVTSGYAGGQKPHPTYQQVCTGSTGHAEVVQLEFDPAVISLEEILEIFFSIHDPTTLNRQGADVGTQYRSVIYYHTPEQEEAARAAIRQLEAEHRFTNPIVTEVAPLHVFYPAEEYHQNYFARNPYQGYCQFVISPKVEKFKKHFRVE